MMRRNLIYLIAMIMACSNINAQVKIIGHRGSSFIAPENTIASAKLAWKHKADAVECDIWLSKDSKIIVSHDSGTKRTTGQDMVIGETASEILRQLDAGSWKDEKYKGQKLPFLYELIKTVPQGKELVIEIKCGAEVIPFMKESITKYGKGRNFSIICFDLPTIIEAKKSFPEYPCYWLCSNADILSSNFSKVKEAGLEGVSLNYSIINEDVIKKASELDLDVYTWTVDDPEEAQRLIKLGVKGITTNRPGYIREQLFL